MGRGGVRNGRPGTSYPNRSDLGAPKPLAPTAAPGQVYGQGTAQLSAQQTLPIAPQPTPSTGGGATGETAPPPVTPGSLGALTAPTTRPGEPLTAGAPIGPGSNLPPAGPPITSPATGTAQLQQLAASGNPALAYLASVSGRA